MELNLKWNNWRVFVVSIVVAIILTPFLVTFYFDFFRSYGGGLLGFPDEFESYPITLMLLYTLFVTFLYTGFAQSPKFLSVFYFVILPLFFFAAAGMDRLLAGFLLLIIGAIAGLATRRFAGK